MRRALSHLRNYEQLPLARDAPLLPRRRRNTGTPLPLNGWRTRAAMRASGPASAGEGAATAKMLATNRAINNRDKDHLQSCVTEP